ncbi:hypothetical protein ACFPYI_09335 [Halomarina salina]|uniref:Uncharacterized protein n=1 Tax=Halomarina salina TaxID=1872699 RepID=A0ABD5RLQ4_9EURY|nr:hypothetical protein [Halomarina salina]
MYVLGWNGDEYSRVAENSSKAPGRYTNPDGASTAGVSRAGPKVPLEAGGDAAGDEANDEERSESWECSDRPLSVHPHRLFGQLSRVD